jgi:hypothetical protein
MNTNVSGTKARWRAAIAIGAAALFVAGGCSNDEPAPIEQSTENTTPNTTEAPTAGDTTSIDQAIWYAGFKVTLGDAELSPGASGGDLVIEAEFENQGSDSAGFNDVAVALSSEGENYEPGLDTDLPTVPGEAKGKGSFAFAVESSFSLDDAVLTIGNPDNNQAVVPLGDEGELVTNEPVPVITTASGTAGPFTLQLKGGEIRFDDPETHRPIEKGHTLVILDFDLTRAGGENDITFIGDENLALTLPDGTSVAVRNDGISNPAELVAPGATLKDLTARFEGDIPYAGTYTLVLKYDGSEGPAQAEIPFTVTELQGGTTGTTGVTGTTNN